MENFEEQVPQEQPEVQPEAQQEVKQIPEQPVYQQPVYQQPVYQQPIYQQPVYQQPVYQQPIYQQPVYQQSVHQPEYQPATPEQPKKSGKAWKPIIAGLLILALVVGSCGITAAGINAYWQQQNMALSRSFEEKLAVLRQEVEDKSYVGNGNSISGTPNTTPDGSLTPAQVYAKHVASVVAIECTVGSFFQQGVAFGSGFILTADGYIATNYHVVEGAKSIRVVCSNGDSYTAAYVGGDEDNDIAVIKAEATDLQPATIGSSDHLIVGDQVVAIGNPLGTLASTLTVGYVSAKDRLITTEGSSINMIQTDAAINPGNSGGPLFNMKGEVIGITSAKYSGLTSSGATIEGIGFAIPMDDVIGMLRDLMEKGYISGAYLAVNVGCDPENGPNLWLAPGRPGLQCGTRIERAASRYSGGRCHCQPGRLQGRECVRYEPGAAEIQTRRHRHGDGVPLWNRCRGNRVPDA